MLVNGATFQTKLEAKFTSATNSEGESSLSARKKPFVRKPATSQHSNTSEKKRKVNEQQINSTIMSIKEFQVEPSPNESPVKINFVKRRERQTQIYNKDKETAGETFQRLKKDASFSPFYSSKKILDPAFFPKQMSARQIDMPSNLFTPQPSYTSTPSCSRFIVEQNKNDIPFPCYINPHKKIDPAYILNPTSNLTISPAASYSKLLRNNAVQPKQPPRTAKESSGLECAYCRNNKEAIDIMCEKYRKMEEQLNAKNEKIKELTGKLQKLREEHGKLTEKYENRVETAQLKEIQFMREREEIIGRLDSYKMELTRTNERLRYLDMQNGVLLRYKDEMQLMEKEYDLMLAENQRLQQTITALRRPQEDKFKKNKQETSTPRQPVVSYVNGAKPIMPRHNIDDDLVSLSLSERSFDQF